MLSEANIGRLQRWQVYQQAAWEEREFADNLLRKEEERRGKKRKEEERSGGEENTALMVDLYTWNCHNRWSLLQRLIAEGRLSSRAVSWLRELEYEGIEALEEEAEWEADKLRQMEAWLDDELTRSLCWVMSHFVFGRLVL